jgi:hypothetical protein
MDQGAPIRQVTVLQWIYAIESWALMALGVVHMGSTFRLFSAYTNQAHWFLGAGALMVLVGALNLLNRAYGRGAPGLRLVCIGTNIIILVFSVAGGIVGRASVVAWIFVLGIVAPLALLSCMRAINR